MPRHAEVARRDVVDEQAGVVAVSVDRPGIRRDAVLLQARDALPDGAREVDPRCRGALVRIRHDGQAAAPEDAHADVLEVEERRAEARGRDDLVDLGHEGLAGGRPAGVHGEAAGMPLDALDGGIEDEDATAEVRVLPGLQVAGPHAAERVQVHRELGRPGRGEDDGAGPLEQAAGQLEARVLLADDEEAPVGVAGRIAGVGIVRGVLDARGLGQQRLGDAHREDDDAAAVLAGGRVEDVCSPSREVPCQGRLVGDPQPGPLGEEPDARLHLRSGRELGGAVHERPA